MNKKIPILILSLLVFITSCKSDISFKFNNNLEIQGLDKNTLLIGSKKEALLPNGTIHHEYIEYRPLNLNKYVLDYLFMIPSSFINSYPPIKGKEVIDDFLKAKKIEDEKLLKIAKLSSDNSMNTSINDFFARESAALIGKNFNLIFEKEDDLIKKFPNNIFMYLGLVAKYIERIDYKTAISRYKDAEKLSYNLKISELVRFYYIYSKIYNEDKDNKNYKETLNKFRSVCELYSTTDDKPLFRLESYNKEVIDSYRFDSKPYQSLNQYIQLEKGNILHNSESIILEPVNQKNGFDKYHDYGHLSDDILYKNRKKLTKCVDYFMDYSLGRVFFINNIPKRNYKIDRDNEVFIEYNSYYKI